MTAMTDAHTRTPQRGIGTKLGLGFAAVLGLVVIIAVVAWLRLNSLTHTLQDITQVEWPKAQAANRLSSLTAAATRLTLQQLSVNASERGLMRDEILAVRKAYEETEQYLRTHVTTPQAHQALQTLQEQREIYRQSQGAFYGYLDSGDEILAASELNTTLLPALQQMQHLTDAMSAMGAQNAATHGSQALAQVELARWVIAGLLALALLLGGVLAVWITRTITRPIAQAVQLAQAVAAGDLNQQVRITTHDETGQLLQALNRMSAELRRIVGQVRSGSLSIASACTQVASGSGELSTRTEEQASALEETAAAMQELSSTVAHNYDSSQRAVSLAQDANQVAHKGGAVVTQAVQTMQQVNASAQQIANIIGIIDGIAFQTNILALNAAVEAARAGEQGRGFAVVASEVRALAGRSADAAKQIKQLIEQSVQGIHSGCALVEQAGSTMQDIVQSVRSVAELVSEISAASREQSTGLEQIKHAVMQIDSVTQQNAALVEEGAAAAQTMEHQTQALVAAVAVFQVDDSAPATPSPFSLTPHHLTAPMPGWVEQRPAAPRLGR